MPFKGFNLQKMIKINFWFIIFINIKLFQIPDKGEDGWKGGDDKLLLLAWDHVLAGIVDEVIGIENLLGIILGILEGLINRGLFRFSVFTPSSVQCPAIPMQTRAGWYSTVPPGLTLITAVHWATGGWATLYYTTLHYTTLHYTTLHFRKAH